MTSILLDTNALLWLVASPERAHHDVLEALADPLNELLVSAASAWEIAIKTRNGRLDGAPLLLAWDDVLEGMNAADLAIDSLDAATAGGLAWEHKDPFDRMIVAQAARRGLTVATSDHAMIAAGLTPTMDTRGPNA